MSTLTKKVLTERLKWLEAILEENQMQSEIVWFIYNNYRNKFLKEKE